MYTAAVLYVGDLGRMRTFYEQSYQMTALDHGPGYVGLERGTWLLTLVESTDARPATHPPRRRAGTAVKLAFEVRRIDALREIIAGLGGEVGPSEAEWSFRNAVHCDCIDPEGNVVQLVQPDIE
jgi:predicted enzyme related to lactoylglutathione lyase